MKEVPFIKLIKSPNNYYVFDVNRNNIIKVSKDLYCFLQELSVNQEIGCKNEKVQTELLYLNEKGYLSNNKISIIRHPETDFLETYLERKINKITLQVTQNCNLRCSYCVYSDFYNNAQRIHSGKRMTLDIAKTAIDFLAKHSIDNERVNVAFYGGEPLLEFELIKNVIEYTKNVFLGKELSFSITTNATMLTLEMFEYFNNNDIDLTVSLDGPKEIHDINRRFADNGKGSYEVIIKNLKEIKKSYPEYFKKIHINMVIDPQNDFDIINSIFDSHDIFDNGNIHSTIIDDSYSIEKITYSDEYLIKRNYNIFLAYLTMQNRIKKSEVSPIAFEEVTRLSNIIQKMSKISSLPNVGTHSGPCIPGQLRLFIDFEGNFYPCERVSEDSTVMRIGNLRDGFNYEKARTLLNIGELTSEECRNCWAINHCTICAKYADDGNKLSKEKILSYCSGIRERTLYDMKNIILFKEFNLMFNDR